MYSVVNPGTPFLPIPVEWGTNLTHLAPATGKVFTTASEGTAKDVDLAVEAAQNAYENVWGLNVPGLARSNILWKLAQLMEANASELAAIEALDNGVVLEQ